MSYKRYIVASTLAGILLSAATAQASPNLILNGGFEQSDNGFSGTETPVDWINIGHIDGVISYGNFNTPAYEGNYFYDEGGYGDAANAPGDGIEQTVATTPGQIYTLTFGLTGENFSGEEIADVTIGSQLNQYILDPDPDYGELAAPFVTYNISYTATSALTTIAFTTDASSPSFGDNDPMIDGISFTAGGVSAAPEPSTWALMLLGLGGAGYVLRQAKKNYRLSFSRALSV